MVVDVSSSATLVLALVAAWTALSTVHWAGVFSMSGHLYPLNIIPFYHDDNILETK